VEPIKQRNPQATEQIEREQKVLKTLKQEERTVTANVDNKEATADAKDARADALLAALAGNGAGSAATRKPEKPTPASSSQVKPDIAKPPKPADRSAPKP
jgi:septal ring factor EnvC (AmiA/AmiB activator)